jgi:formylglycine-generating enzyme required for sulfatase activity
LEARLRRILPLLFFACQTPVVVAPDDSADSATPDTDIPIVDVDEDGDGYAPWTETIDPARADCDDTDATVTPETERYVATGTFWRGDDMFPETSPMTQITLSDYCVDVHEVTNSEFVVLLEAQEAKGMINITDEGLMLFDFMDDDDNIDERIVLGNTGVYEVSEGYTDHPVVEVFHWSGSFYCAQEGKDLPTEAEWEKAARGPDDPHIWPWGLDDPTCETANIMLILEDGGTELCVGDTTPVGSYPGGASPYGLLDMSGNAAEWILDWYQADYYADAPSTDPQGPESGEAEFDEVLQPARLSRGGAYATESGQASVIYRYPEREAGSSNGVGFRCVRRLMTTADGG